MLDALPEPAMIGLLLLAGVWAGAQNALAGGGSFITLPALIAAGLDPKLANITSTMALFPGQITTGLAGRKMVAGAERLSFRALAIIALAGGVAGALLLNATPTRVFSALVPWLVLLATAVFAWGSFGPKKAADRPPPPAWVTVLSQSTIAVYSGFFGGGAGILTLASLTIAGQAVRNAGGTKNVLVSLSNTTAAILFALTGNVAWAHALVVGIGAMAGGYAGARLLAVVPEKTLKLAVIVIGVALTVGLFLRG
ncbi:MAG: sulfite exporter TauE/SafE family protein [Sandarakinorhabdus sp.]